MNTYFFVAPKILDFMNKNKISIPTRFQLELCSFVYF